MIDIIKLIADLGEFFMIVIHSISSSVYPMIRVKAPCDGVDTILSEKLGKQFFFWGCQPVSGLII